MILAYFLWFLLPLWVLAGIADYVCHRRTALERTSGLGESELHVLQAIQIAVPLLAGLFLELDALVLTVMILSVIAHTLTALRDETYTAARRYISPLERHVHSHLEYIPIVAVSLVVMLYWRALAAPSFALHPKEHPIPVSYLVAVLVPVLLVQGVLLTEETWRAWRAAQRVREDWPATRVHDRA